MARKCKCKICGDNLTTDIAFLVERETKSGRKVREYYCSEEEYTEHKRDYELWRKNQRAIDDILGYVCVNNVKNREMTAIYYAGHSKEQVNNYLIENKERIKDTLDKKASESNMNEYQKLRYIFAIIRSEIKDYVSEGKRKKVDTTEYEEVGANIEIETEIKKPIIKKKKARGGLLDIL